MSKTPKIIITIVMAAVCALVYYLALPAVTFSSPGFWWYIILCLACVAISISMFAYDTDAEIAIWISWGVVGLFVVALIVCAIISATAFHTEKARSVADVTVSEVGIDEAFPDLVQGENCSNLPLVDLDTARMLGDKKLAGLEHASWYDVDDAYNLITYNGKYYRISAIDYGDLFKFNKARDDGLPGYVLVEVTPKNGVVTQEATMATLEKPIRYSPGAYWSHDLRRHLRGQYPTYMFDDSHMEVDEEGTPYWITGVKRPTAGLFGVKTVTSVIVTNAQSGSSDEYRVDEAPEWIDHVFSLGYLMDIAKWHYEYTEGWWNTTIFGSKTNVWYTSYQFRDQHRSSSDSAEGKFANFFGYSSIINEEGQVLFYTGLTAANSAESNLGWLTIDTSSGKMIEYRVVGAEESSAQAAVEQLVQAQNYEATFPLPANIDGQPSYIMCLKGKAGLTQGYAICNVENYSIAVQAETLDAAIAQYLRRLGNDIPDTPSNDGDNVPEPTQHETTQSVGKIEAVYTAEIGGTTQFYYVIDGQLYRAAITVNEQQVLYQIGDEIIFGWYDAEIRVITDISRKQP